MIVWTAKQALGTSSKTAVTKGLFLISKTASKEWLLELGGHFLCFYSENHKTQFSAWKTFKIKQNVVHQNDGVLLKYFWNPLIV